MRWTMASTCVCSSATCSSVASGDTTYTSSYFLLIRLLLDYGPSTRRLRALAQGKESVNIGRVTVRDGLGIRVKRIHHVRDALRGKHLRGISRAGDERFEIGQFAFLEPGEHVIGQV